ncbi:rod shape-determining protein MreD [Candidatus Pantoea edessiphila]|uniref:Rod shape-determining protein MreD n=2 Tax=Candidatus Pantoea edessiphila TaxID=2044610 RepID=A0A2P5SZY2_9GAMM|nr:rod shape-determining protein MreD [Candidatus Pantoea edessiphila]
MPWPNIIYMLRPSWLLMFLIYLVLSLPHSINISSGFLIGILVDITAGSTLGISSLPMSIIAYFISIKFEFIRNSNLLQQVLIVVLISIFMNLTIFLIEFLVLGVSFRYEIFLNSIMNGMIWPFFLLLKRYLDY